MQASTSIKRKHALSNKDLEKNPEKTKINGREYKKGKTSSPSLLSNYHNSLAKMTDPFKLTSDCKIVLKEKKICFIQKREILKNCELSVNHHNEIHLENLSLEDFSKVSLFITRGELNLDESNFKLFLAAAHVIKSEILKELCEIWICLNIKITNDNYQELFDLATKSEAKYLGSFLTYFRHSASPESYRSLFSLLLEKIKANQHFNLAIKFIVDRKIEGCWQKALDEIIYLNFMNFAFTEDLLKKILSSFPNLKIQSFYGSKLDLNAKLFFTEHFKNKPI